MHVFIISSMTLSTSNVYDYMMLSTSKSIRKVNLVPSNSAKVAYVIKIQVTAVTSHFAKRSRVP